MALSIAAAIGRIKASLNDWLTPDIIHEICRQAGHQWRDRILDPVTTIHLFALQILHGNTACAHVPRLANVQCTGEAYGLARSRLPLTVFQKLLAWVTQRLPVVSAEEGRWRGHRTYLIDGSSTSMPDTPGLQARYGQPGRQAAGCGFPVMHLMALFQASTGFLLTLVSAPHRTHDMAEAPRTHPALAAGDVLVGDRGFCSFVHLALLGLQGVFGVLRTHQKQIVSFRSGRRHATRRTRKQSRTGLPTSTWRKRLGRHDQLVEYPKPQLRPQWMTAEQYAALPATIRVRELRYTVAVPGRRTGPITLSTTLLDPVRYPAADLAALYGRRWEIETNFNHLKTTLKMDVLHCKTVAGVEKELLMYALVYNLIRLVMLEAARQQKVPVERISFVDAARWFCQALEKVPKLKLRINPNRPNRGEPRAKKRRPKNYALLNTPRQKLKERLKNMAKAR